jgi:hypothetical protein
VDNCAARAGATETIPPTAISMTTLEIFTNFISNSYPPDIGNLPIHLTGIPRNKAAVPGP